MTKRGMTLVEAMMVLGIIGALTALAGPNLMALVRSTRARGEASTLVALLGTARAQAMTRGFPVVVCIAPTRTPSIVLYKKGDPVLPPAVVTAATAPYLPSATPNPDKVLDTKHSEPLTKLRLPEAAPSATIMHLVFAQTGRVSAFFDTSAAATCSDTPSGSLAAGTALTFRVSSSDPAHFQELVLRADGLARLTP